MLGCQMLTGIPVWGDTHVFLIPYWFWAHRPQGLGAIVPGGGALGLTQAQGPLVAHWQSGKSPIGQQATSQP